MRSRASVVARHRRALVAAMVLALMGAAIPARAQDPAQSVQSAQAALQAAQAQAQAQDNALASAKANLAATEVHLADLHAQVAVLTAKVSNDRAMVAAITQQVNHDRQRVATYVRAAYEGGQDAPLLYVLSAGNVEQAFQRQAAVDNVGKAGRGLITQLAEDQAVAERTLKDAQAAHDELTAKEAQAVTLRALISAEVDQVTVVDAQAKNGLADSQNQLTAALQAQAVAAALARARQNAGLVFVPVGGTSFTVDTDLTQPSGETAAGLNAFLNGTALGGTGDAFLAAEQKYHVNARYFLAHAILESAFGTSAIARDKHNIFGYGANDSNPYNNAVSFPSFAACIDYVAQKVSQNYLTPGGAYYHGPTLRGMNVSYASDPNWAAKIASIARSLP